jgi:hypothetical protein
LLHNSALSTHDWARLFNYFSVDIATDLHNFNTSPLWWRSRLRMRGFLLGVLYRFHHLSVLRRAATASRRPQAPPDMRQDFKMGHRWDAERQWQDNRSGDQVVGWTT